MVRIQILEFFVFLGVFQPKLCHYTHFVEAQRSIFFVVVLSKPNHVMCFD
jgi:hypothetical protein